MHHAGWTKPNLEEEARGVNSIDSIQQLPGFSRVLRDSMNRYVGQSVGLSVGRFALAFFCVFCITAPAFSCFVFWSLGLLGLLVF